MNLESGITSCQEDAKRGWKTNVWNPNTSDLESAAIVNARFNLSEEGVKAQVKLQTGEVWAELSRTLTHISDMDLDPEQNIAMRRAARKLSDKKIADMEKNSGRM